MLVPLEETLIITQICAGQYHNALVADGNLYTWGWGVYGQLGHSNVENEYVPRPVTFFKNKKILQLALGHAHTMVLCRELQALENTLYVFGSNHYGSLGLGHGDDSSSKSYLKSTTPVILKLDEDIRMIHTKFFANVSLLIELRFLFAHLFCLNSSL